MDTYNIFGAESSAYVNSHIQSNFKWHVLASTENQDYLQTELFTKLEQIVAHQIDDLSEHLDSVGILSAKLALQLGMSPSYVKMIYHAARLHDIGKVGISQRILQLPRLLTPDERKVMEQHCQIGADLIGKSNTTFLNMARNIVVAHHERWNGSGYPFALKKTDIPFEARIVSVADVFDALIRERPYKKAWTIDAVIALFVKTSGTHFDPVIVNALLEILDFTDSSDSSTLLN